MLDKCKQYFTEIISSPDLITKIFILVWGTGWFANAKFGMHFDLSSLQGMYLTVILPKVGIHGINSMFNSPPGMPPGSSIVGDNK